LGVHIGQRAIESSIPPKGRTAQAGKLVPIFTVAVCGAAIAMDILPKIIYKPDTKEEPFPRRLLPIAVE
jgi:hypothetical protein